MNSVVTVFNLIVHRVTVVTSFSLCSCLTRVYLAGRLPKLKLTLSLNRAALAKGKLIKQNKNSSCLQRHDHTTSLPHKTEEKF